MLETPGADSTFEPVRVDRWPTERLLLALVVLASTALWIVLAVSIIGAVYAAMLALFFVISHLVFVAYVRGSGIRIGSEQLPALYDRIRELSSRAGLERVPEAYVLQAGGALNALATAFLRSKILILFSDLLDACGEDEGARDMIIGHELGHIRAGHLRWRWFLLPGFMVPFLGSAYSQAREHTCDRYGAALCGDRKGALLGLSILAAGGKHGRLVNLRSLARQREALDTGLMRIGAWLSSHPPISERIATLDPSLVEGTLPLTRGRVRALLIIATAVLIPLLAGGLFVRRILPEIRKGLDMASADVATPAAGLVPAGDVEEKRRLVARDFDHLAGFIRDLKEREGWIPSDDSELYEAWIESHPGVQEPFDPFDGKRYGYSTSRGEFWLWSAGPDGVSDTEDDLWGDSGGFRE